VIHVLTAVMTYFMTLADSKVLAPLCAQGTVDVGIHVGEGDGCRVTATWATLVISIRA
jgi:hypothetical protein